MQNENKGVFVIYEGVIGGLARGITFAVSGLNSTVRLEVGWRSSLVDFDIFLQNFAVRGGNHENGRGQRGRLRCRCDPRYTKNRR